MIFEYEILRLIWWALLGVLLMGFAVMDGFDMGAASLMPFLGRNDSERRVIINTVGPVWEGNQVWLILGGGAVFAAWPYLYAVAFSGFYLAMFIVLCALILRPVGFKFRSKMPSQRWRSVWDACLFIGGTVPPIIFGVAIGNAIQGVPFTFDDTMRMTYEGSFWALLNPFALLCGIVSLCMILSQGASWLAVKTEGVLHRRALMSTFIFSIAAAVLFAAAGIWIQHGIDGYHFTSVIHMAGPSNPLLKTVERVKGAWLDNFVAMPALGLVPVMGLFGAMIAAWSAMTGRSLLAFLGSSLLEIGVIGTFGIAMFPFLLPSSSNPNASLTIWDSSSSATTLTIMMVATALFMPVIIAYTSWVYYVLRGKVTASHVKEHSDSLY